MNVTRYPDGWIVFTDDDEVELGRFKLPENFTMADLEKCMEHMRAELRRKAVGPS